MATIQVEQGSLTSGNALVLVNASNTQGNLGSGVSAAIAAACGAGFQAEIHQALHQHFGASMEPGSVLLTSAGKHPRARHVAHVAVMDYRAGFTGDSFPSLGLIERCCVNLWAALETLPGELPVTVAMVALGAGTGQLGVKDSVAAACVTLRRHLEKPSRIQAVTFYGYQLVEYLAMAHEVARHFGWEGLGVAEAERAQAELLHGPDGDG
jgi:O-acetyl-ADP-ribose deacetylase (regulator of RNase III)